MKRELSNIIQNELKDPRLSMLISIVGLKVTKDLKFAKAYISVLGSEEEKSSTLQGLKSAAGYIRREVGHRMQLRSVPEIHFEMDNSIEQGVYISKLINETLKHDKQ
jgi:ribosome-binding factor A